MHESTVGEAYMQEIQEFFKLTLLEALVIYIGTTSSVGISENTCIWTCASKYLFDMVIPLGILKSTIDQPIDHLVVIVPPRKTLKNIFSSTWVIE
jgi:hypothetical protein